MSRLTDNRVTIIDAQGMDASRNSSPFHIGQNDIVTVTVIVDQTSGAPAGTLELQYTDDYDANDLPAGSANWIDVYDSNGSKVQAPVAFTGSDQSFVFAVRDMVGTFRWRFVRTGGASDDTLTVKIEKGV